mmetsp:Transcript_23284/g.43227  ORF Transcript_23284/g.43227 Transcript_23284/m.43227 type:complete len:81 (+) Transcript_23284:86-328(+)
MNELPCVNYTRISSQIEKKSFLFFNLISSEKNLEFFLIMLLELEVAITVAGSAGLAIQKSIQELVRCLLLPLSTWMNIGL